VFAAGRIAGHRFVKLLILAFQLLGEIEYASKIFKGHDTLPLLKFTVRLMPFITY
jgi:hypothetical protein